MSAVERVKDKSIDAYTEILHDLEKSANLLGAVLSSADGLIIASSIKGGEEDRIAAMSAAGYNLGMKIIEEISKGELEQITIKSDQGLVVMSGIGEDAVLTAVAEEDASLGFVLVEMKRANKEIGKILLS